MLEHSAAQVTRAGDERGDGHDIRRASLWFCLKKCGAFADRTPLRLQTKARWRASASGWSNTAWNHECGDGRRVSREDRIHDEELDLFRGEILGLSGGADFYGKNPKELRTEFKKALQVFLAVCKEKGLEPRRRFSGEFSASQARQAPGKCMR